MIKTICYISDSIKYDNLDKIKALYKRAKANNLKNNITGVLIYKSGNFLQVLEGKPANVDFTFNKIKHDPRHSNLFKVIDTEIEHRIFEDYNFGFTIINNKDELKNLLEYFDWLKAAENKIANKVIAMVENFIDYE
ncbi:BLUF domain-containing protein [Gelatiniphilus marinus]|uniref:BLUF domain-containing protein n=1 Tax=Gelatiniphilus marinus TaxID=1759464 RepID=A0ABW5JS47_9FLAO